jgi:hypothetical protein
MFAMQAAHLGIQEEEAVSFAESQINYILGDGAGHSYVVGWGTNPPQRPHHRHPHAQTSRLFATGQLTTIKDQILRLVIQIICVFMLVTKKSSLESHCFVSNQQTLT